MTIKARKVGEWFVKDGLINAQPTPRESGYVYNGIFYSISTIDRCGGVSRDREATNRVRNYEPQDIYDYARTKIDQENYE